MRGRIPPLALLQSFVDFVETANVTRSAERLNLTQSAVSHHIAQLEAFFGASLFDRQGRTVRPTAPAIALAARLRDQLAEMARTLDAARLEAKASAVRLAVVPEVLDRWLRARLDRFRAAHPGIAIAIRADTRRDALSDGETDIQIRLGRPTDAQDGFTLAEDDEIAVCSPDLAARLPPREAFQVAPFLAERTASRTHLDWDRWLAEVFGLDDRVLRERHAPGARIFDGLEPMLAACRRGEGFALVRTLLVADDLASGRPVSPFTERLRAELNYSVIVARDPAPGPAVRALLDWLRREAAVRR